MVCPYIARDAVGFRASTFPASCFSCLFRSGDRSTSRRSAKLEAGKLEADGGQQRNTMPILPLSIVVIVLALGQRGMK
jgi:hypothetical protein